MLLWRHEEDIKQTNKQKILFLQVELFFSFNNEYYTDLKKEANINGESGKPRLINRQKAVLGNTCFPFS